MDSIYSIQWDKNLLEETLQLKSAESLCPLLPPPGLPQSEPKWCDKVVKWYGSSAQTSGSSSEARSPLVERVVRKSPMVPTSRSEKCELLSLDDATHSFIHAIGSWYA